MLPTLRALVRRVRHLALRRSFERDLDDELRFHVDMQAAAHEQGGMSTTASRRAAEREFGSATRHKEDVRDARGLTPLDDLARDTRFAARVLKRDSGFTTMAIVTLALGIGATTAVFGVVNGVLLEPLPYPEPERLVAVYESSAAYPINNIAPPNFHDFRAQSRSFAGFAAYGGGEMTVLGGRDPLTVDVAAVTDDFFQVLGAAPMVGRAFTADEQRVGGTPVALVSHAFWERQLASQPLGQARLSLMGHVYAVIGVMPPAFDFPERTQVWVPASPWEGGSSRSAHNYAAIARLASGATVRSAASELTTIALRIRARFPGESDATAAAVIPLRDDLVGDVRMQLTLLLGAVGFVLLVACANLASAGLARASARGHELAIRTALGASRGRLARQLVTEHLLLAGAGGAAGLALAAWLVRALVALTPMTLPRASNLGINARVAAFAVAITLAAGLFIALFQVLQLGRAALREAMASGGRGNVGAGRGRLRRALVSAEVALALVLLAGAGLLVRSFRVILSRDLGFDPRGVLAVDVALPDVKYEANANRVAYYDASLSRLRALPGVTSASLINRVPLVYGGFDGLLEIDGAPMADEATRMRNYANYRVVSGEYFSTMRIPLLAGRLFSTADDSMAPHVTVVNRAMADRMWPGQNPIGQRVRSTGMDRHPKVWMTVVGVVGNVRQAGLAREPRPEHYVSYRQRPDRADVATLLVRTSLPPTSIAGAARTTLRALDTDVPLTVATMDDVLSKSLADRRFSMLVLTAFGGVALALAAIGIYGVLSYVVTQRTREIGVRVALGAGRASVVRLIARDSAGPVVIGVVIGVLGAMWLTRLMRSLLFGVSATDGWTFGVAVLLLVSVAALAALIPARRASRVDPVVALRAD